MNDNDVLAILISAFETGLAANGFTAPEVAQSYQTTHQGINDVPTWYIHRVTSNRYGFQGSRQAYNEVTGLYDVTESWLLERTYQISTYKNQSTSNPTETTAFDMADIAAGVAQSQAFRDTLKANGIGIYRITSVRENYFSDESNENELSTNFDFTIQYCREITSTVEPAQIRGEVHNT